MKAISRILVGLFLGLMACDQNEEIFGQQEKFRILTSREWVSEKFYYEGNAYDSIELLATVVDTIENTSPVLYPGDEFRAVIWVELIFSADSLFFNDRNSTSFLKCQNCVEFVEYYHYTEPSFGQFSLTDNLIDTKIRQFGEWQPGGSYPIDYISSSNIRIDRWVNIPLGTDSTEIDVTHINGVPAGRQDYVFDVRFRAE